MKMYIFLKDGRCFVDEESSFENACNDLLNHYILDCNREEDILRVEIR